MSVFEQIEQWFAMNEGGEATDERQLLSDAADEIERLTDLLKDYWSQWSQIAECLGGDARDCKESPRTMAGFVRQAVGVLRADVEKWVEHYRANEEERSYLKNDVIPKLEQKVENLENELESWRAIGMTPMCGGGSTTFTSPKTIEQRVAALEAKLTGSDRVMSRVVTQGDAS